MRSIIPHLWYDKEAGEAAGLYTSLMPNSFIKNVTAINDTPSGTAELLSVELAGQEFMLISAGPYFKFTPAVSFFIACENSREVESLWKTLSQGGTALMPLGAYPFSEKYGWLSDRYGLSWQIMHMGGRRITQKITPTLMFTGDHCGKAEEAMRFYAAVFPGGRVGDITRYEPGDGPDEPGTVKHAAFTVQGTEFAAMDSAHEHHFGFNEAVSFIVKCDSQEDIDYYWKALSADPSAEACGWLKDKYGVSWQITPTAMDEMMGTGDPKKTARVTDAFLKMKKFDIAELQKAFNGE